MPDQKMYLRGSHHAAVPSRRHCWIVCVCVCVCASEVCGHELGAVMNQALCGSVAPVIVVGLYALRPGSRMGTSSLRAGPERKGREKIHGIQRRVWVHSELTVCFKSR